MDFSLLIPLAPFIMVIAIVFIVTFFKSRDRNELQKTLRTAIEKGVPLTREDLSLTRADKPKPEGGDIRSGMILIAVGMGTCALGLFLGWDAGDWRHPVVGASLIPFLIGIALLVYGVFNARNAPKD